MSTSEAFDRSAFDVLRNLREVLGGFRRLESVGTEPLVVGGRAALTPSMGHLAPATVDAEVLVSRTHTELAQRTLRDAGWTDDHRPRHGTPVFHRRGTTIAVIDALVDDGNAPHDFETVLRAAAYTDHNGITRLGLAQVTLVGVCRELAAGDRPPAAAALTRIFGLLSPVGVEILLDHGTRLGCVRGIEYLFALAGIPPGASGPPPPTTAFDARTSAPPVEAEEGPDGPSTTQALGLTVDLPPRVFTPEPHLELLVQSVRAHVPTGAEGAIAEVGAGAGAGAIRIALDRPGCEVFAIDRQRAAIDAAAHNARSHNAANVTPIHGSLLNTLPADAKPLLAIFTNIPYITMRAAGAAYSHNNDVYGPGADGLDLLRGLALQASRLLAPGGLLAFCCQAHQVKSMHEFLDALGFDTEQWGEVCRAVRRPVSERTGDFALNADALCVDVGDSLAITVDEGRQEIELTGTAPTILEVLASGGTRDEAASALQVAFGISADEADEQVGTALADLQRLDILHSTLS